MPQEKLLKDYSDEEKGAYISAIASLATADRTASEEEHGFLQDLADSAELSGQQVNKINAAADDTTGQELKESLDVLKNSELKFSLLTDLVAFAESDHHHSDAEKANIEKMAAYLNITPDQVAVIHQLVDEASRANLSQEQAAEPGILSSLGLDQRFKSAGLNMGNIAKSLIAIAGPMILQRLLSRKGTTGRMGGSMRNDGMGTGGLGSLIAILNGGRGIGSTGGLLGRVLKGGF